MSTEQISFKQALRAMIEAERRGSPAPPVELEKLMSYEEGDLSNEEETKLREHLVRHREDARLLVDSHDFPDLEPTESSELSDHDVAVHWRLLQRRLQNETDSELQAPGQPSRNRWMRRSAYALAASLALAVLTTLLLINRPQHLPSARSQPESNVAIHDLFPTTSGLEFRDESDRGTGQSRSTVLEVPAHAQSLLLALNLADLRSFAAYRLELTTADGERLFTVDDLARGVEGGFTIQLSRNQLPPNKYHVDLFGLTANGAEELLAKYRFETVFRQ